MLEMTLFSLFNVHFMVSTQSVSEDNTDLVSFPLPWWDGVENQGKQVKLVD